MTDSPVVNRLIQEARVRGELIAARRSLMDLLTIDPRYADQATAEIQKMVAQETDLARLDDWFDAGIRSRTYAEFLANLRL